MLAAHRGSKVVVEEYAEMKEAASDETIQVDETESAMRKYRNTPPPPHPNAVPPQGRVGTASDDSRWILSTQW
uniref:Uncharacterized protein n=1 Tax=Oryza punctata TaxID=4537 RepID=A0A0E0KG72_ORYPU